MSSEADQVAAVKEALAAVNVSAYTPGDLAAMSSLPAYYAELHVTERAGGVRTSGARSSARLWLVQVRAVAQKEANARNVRRLVRDALEDRFLTIGGVESSGIVAGPSDPIAADSGWFSGLSDFTYSH